MEGRVVDAAEVGLGIGADRGDPLPVAVVVGLVAVEQVAHEVALAPSPVDPQVFRQEGSDDQPRAVVHPALAQELAHAGVDERVARAALLPGLERLLRVGPLDLAVALLVLRARVPREVEQHVVVEVPPAELAVERGRALAASAGEPLLDLSHRDAAQVQVRRQARGAVRAERVVVVGVGLDVAGEEGVEALARGCLPSRHGLGDLLGEPERLQRRQPARVRPAGHRDLARSLEQRPALDALPVAVEGREHGVWLALLRGDVVDVDRVQPRVGVLLDPGVGERLPRALATLSRERTDVVGEVDLVRPGLLGELRQLHLGLPDADEELAAALAELVAQLAQRLEQELGSGAGRVPASI